MRRGEVWWAELPPPIGRRPVVLLSRDAAYRVRTSVTIGMVTRTIRAIPVEVPLGAEDGMPQEWSSKEKVGLQTSLTAISATSSEKVAAVDA